MGNLIKNLHTAKQEKNDEFYTRIETIEKEVFYYSKQFEGKTVFLNADDPESSNFFKFFRLNFQSFKLKKIYATHYVEEGNAYMIEVNNVNQFGEVIDAKITPLKGNGDFRSPEAIELLKKSDIVVTNPPFSLFREFIAQLIKYNKKFLILGNNNAITYNDVFRLIKEGKVRLGYNVNRTEEFEVPAHYEFRQANNGRIGEDGKKYLKVQSISWFTNLDVDRKHLNYDSLFLFRSYYDDPTAYPKYDNFDAIEVSKLTDIPFDYEGFMGVPITFLGKHDPEQFEIIGKMSTTQKDEYNFGYPFINGRKKYARIIIKNKKPITKEEYLRG